MRRLRSIKVAAPFHDQRMRSLNVLVRGDRREEVARVRKAVRADWPAIRQCETIAVVLTHISARAPVDGFNAEDDTARNDADLTRLDLDHAEFGAEAQPAPAAVADDYVLL